MSEPEVSAKDKSIAIGGNAAGPVVNLVVEKGLILNLTKEQRIEQQLPSFLGKLILVFSQQSLSEYGKGARRKLSLEVSDKLKHNDFPPHHRVIRDFLRYAHVLETSYLGVEQRNSDARFLVRRKAGIAYETEIQMGMDAASQPDGSKLDYVRAHASVIIANVIGRLFEDYKSSCEIKVEKEIVDLAISLVVADAIVECEVLEKPSDVATA